LWSVPGRSENIILIDVNYFFYHFFFWIQISLPYKRTGDPVHYTLVLENFWTKVGLKVFKFPIFGQSLLVFLRFCEDVWSVIEALGHQHIPTELLCLLTLQKSA